MAKRGRPPKKYFSADKKPADKVEKLRKAYGIDIRTTGVAVVGDKPLPKMNTLSTIENTTQKELKTSVGKHTKKTGAAGKKRVASQLENYGSVTENAYNKWLLDMKNTFPTLDRELYDPTGFIRDNFETIREEVGRPGTKAKAGKRTRTETGYLVKGGSGLRGRLNRIKISYPSLKAELESSEYKFGGLSPEDYQYLETYAGKNALSTNDFTGIINRFNVVQGDKPSKFTTDPRLGQLFMQFMNYRLGRVQIKERTKILDVELEAESQGIPKEVLPYYTQLKKDKEVITVFNEANLKLYLQSPYASDEGLEDYAVLLRGKVSPEIKDILEDIYNNSQSHLSEGGLPIEMKDWSLEQAMDWVKQSYNPIKITPQMIEALKDKLPPQTYKMLKEQIENDELTPESIEYVERLLKGWFGIGVIPEDEPLWEKIKKAYRRMTPKFKVRTEAWFKAAKTEFTGSKYYAVLVELAGRIAERDYRLLFEIDTEIKQWYHNWGNSDERVKELIELLEANTGEKADWGVIDNKDAFEEDDMGVWIAELREWYEGQGYTSAEIDELIKKDLEKI